MEIGDAIISTPRSDVVVAHATLDRHRHDTTASASQSVVSGKSQELDALDLGCRESRPIPRHLPQISQHLDAMVTDAKIDPVVLVGADDAKFALLKRHAADEELRRRGPGLVGLQIRHRNRGRKNPGLRIDM